MRSSWSMLLAIALALSLSCSDDDTATGPDADLVKTQVHLQEGFAGYDVSLEFNGEPCFNAILSEFVSLAGPAAWFSCSLPRGTNRLDASWAAVGAASTFHADSADFYLGDADEYWLSLQAADDTLVVEVRDSPYLYARLAQH